MISGGVYLCYRRLKSRYLYKQIKNEGMRVLNFDDVYFDENDLLGSGSYVSPPFFLSHDRFASVYKGYWKNRLVAIKSLTNLNFAEKFLQEAQLMRFVFTIIVIIISLSLFLMLVRYVIRTLSATLARPFEAISTTFSLNLPPMVL